MNILDKIMADHQKQRNMLKKLVETEDEMRHEIFQRVRRELLLNADAEETYLYQPLARAGESREKTIPMMSEHDQINEIIEQLEETDSTSSKWQDYANLLRQQVLFHLDKEEDKIFELAIENLSEEMLEKLGWDFADVA